MSDPKSSEVEKARDEALRRMLNTPRTPHQPAKAKAKAKAKPKTTKHTNPSR